MKKILALVLAVLMMATVAFAAAGDAGKLVPGNKILLTIDTSATVENGEDAVNGTIGTAAANDLFVLDGASTVDYAFSGNKPEFSSKNYSLNTIKWPSGKDFIDSVKIDDAENKVAIKIKQDYSLVKEKIIKGSFKVIEKGTSKFKTIATVSTGITLNYGEKSEILADGMAVTLEKNKLTKFNGVGSVAYGTVNIPAAGSSTVSVRVYKDEKYYLANDAKANTAVLKTAPEDAVISFVNFPGTPTFNATATLYLYDTDEKSFVYEIKDGKNVKVGKWSEDDGCYVVKARTLGSYVISDKALPNAADDKPANPDTGANDVVGIATALAAVALVSAAAVSLKK